MKRAERIIRQQIIDLSIDRIAPRKAEIEQAIKFMYWQGTFRTKKYNQMVQLLCCKYSQIMYEYEQRLNTEIEARFISFLKQYDLES